MRAAVMRILIRIVLLALSLCASARAFEALKSPTYASKV
jgi:hypothetical protein